MFKNLSGGQVAEFGLYYLITTWIVIMIVAQLVN